MNTNISRHSKHYSRCCAVQALYQWHHTGHDAAEIIEQFIEEKHLQQADKKYFKKLVISVIEAQPQLDLLFQPFLDRALSDLNPVELAILRLAAFELAHCPELPYKVIINEALEIAKDYGAEQSYKYVNAILDALAPKLRPHEYKGLKY
jgi:N utilization substance protein B